MKRKFLIVLLFISISVSFFAMSIEQSSYDINYYKKSFENNQIVNETGKDMDELTIISKDLISYLKGKGGSELLDPHFNEREILHMKDVQGLFSLNRILKYIAIIVYLIILVYFHKINDYKAIGQAFFIGPFFNYLIFIILSVLATIDFNKYFTYFHEIFFKNDLWLLNPKTDLMIQMLPEDFFIGISKDILLFFLLYMVILQVVGYFYMKKGKYNDKRIKKKHRKTFKKR